jgi:small-conductance mechanosensitive channel
MDSFAFLNLQYLNNNPILAILVLLLCLMPFFDAYAPTSYIAIEYLLAITASSVMFFKKVGCPFRFQWLILVILFAACTLTYLLIEPTLKARLWLLALQLGIMVASFSFYRKLNKHMPYYKWMEIAVIIGIILSGIGVACNLFGRFSLSGIFGIASIFAVTQAVVLTLFVEIIIEIVLLQLQSSRLKKGVDKPFDSSTVINKVKGPLVIVAVILWLIMVTSNLNIYHSISNYVADSLTTLRTIGSISFKLLNLLLFFAIIWFAHILQQLISFLFGETGSETEDMTTVSKGHHSRLLITRLLVLLGGYLLAIAASGLPIDKLTFLLGALGVGVGMGLQNVVNNFVSGIILIFDGSLQIGDEIEIGGQAGKVKEIGLRSSTLNTADGAEVIIPNGSILSQNIVNWTFSSNEKRVIVQFSLSGKELDANMINEVINGTLKNIPNAVSQRKPVILYTKVTPDSCSLTVRFWSIINKADHVKSEAMLQLSAAFSAKGIGFE